MKIYGEVAAAYHCMSRLVGGEQWWHDSAKEILRRQLWGCQTFAELRCWPRARNGICSFMQTDLWQTAVKGYRKALFGKGAMPKAGAQPYPDRTQVEQISDSGGNVSLAELLRSLQKDVIS